VSRTKNESEKVSVCVTAKYSDIRKEEHSHVKLTPGKLNDKARFAYTNGQCLALANHFGKDGYRLMVILAGVPKCQKDLITKFSWELAKWFTHVVGVTKDGSRVFDIFGVHKPKKLLKSYSRWHDQYTIMVPIEPDDVKWLIRNGSNCLPQNLELAATFKQQIYDLLDKPQMM